MVRTAIACALLASVVGLGSCRKTPGTEKPAPAAVPDGGGTPLPQANPLARRAALRDAYRLSPDRRALRAVERVRAFVDPSAPASEATAQHDPAGGWTVKCGGSDVGSLPESPDFGDVMRLLIAWATKVESEHPLSLVTVPQPNEDWLVGDRAYVLAEGCDKAWAAGTHTTAVLHDATHALASIVFQSRDGLEVADDVAGQALALIALDRAIGHATTAREESLVAWELGYQAAATKAALALPAGDSLRAFMERDDATLKTAATSAAASKETKYLWLRRLAKLGDHPSDVAWRRTAFATTGADIAVLTARAIGGDIATRRALAEALPAVTMLEIARAAGDPRAGVIAKALEGKPLSDDLWEVADRIFKGLDMERADLFVRFDEALPKIGARATGPFFGTALRQSHARKIFAHAITTESEYHLAWLGSLPSANGMLAGYRPSNGALSKDLFAWLGAKIAFEQARSVRPLVGHLGAATTLGGSSRTVLWESAKEHVEWSEPAMLDACRALAARLDSRPTHRASLSRIAWNSLNDIRLGEEAMASFVDVAPFAFPNNHVWLLELRGAKDKLRELLKLPDLGAADGISVVSWLVKQGALDKPTADKEISRLLADAGEAWRPRDLAIVYYEDQGRWSDARALAEDWLKKHSAQRDLDPVSAQTQIAYTHYMEGHYADALKWAEPASRSYQSTAMWWAALTYEKLGKHDRALALAKAMLARYPVPGSVGHLLEIRWMAGEHADAANDLAAAKTTIAIYGPSWKWSIAPAFVNVFEKSPIADVIAAFTPLLRDNTYRELSYFATELAWRKRHDASFELLARVPANGGDALGSASSAYRDLVALKGETEALAFLQTKVPPPARIAFGDVAFRDGNFSLLWSFVPDPKGLDPESDCVWLGRAAVALREPEDSAHRKLVMDHYRAELSRTGHYPVLGRFLVGLTDETRAAALAIDPKSVCEVSFYMGYRAQIDGRLEDASDFYRSAVETGQMNVAEYHWALSQLYRWRDKGKSLKRLNPMTWDGE